MYTCPYCKKTMEGDLAIPSHGIMGCRKSDVFVSHAQAHAQMPKVKKWMSSKPVACEQCKQPLKHSFVDGRTAFGYWAVMCSVCHSNIGCGLGTGCGQRYDLNTLEKVGG